MEVNRILKKVVPIILIATLIICSCREQVALKLSDEGAFKFWSTSQKKYSIKQLSSNSVQLQSGTVSDTLYAVEKGMIPSNFDMQWVIEGQEYEF